MEAHESDTPETEQPEQPQPETVKDECQCGQRYEFELTPEDDGRITTEFTYVCKKCGTKNTWTR
jgi:predicted SprT family Zn-dependent metalloprotease